MEREHSGLAQFESICAQIDEFEPLPTVVAYPDEEEHEPSQDEQREPLDQLIFAGLVAPY
jgi:predicted methyltransferase